SLSFCSSEHAFYEAIDESSRRQQRDQKISRSAAGRHQNCLDYPSIRPEPVDHRVFGARARIHPFEIAARMKAANVFDLEQHTPRVVRKLLVVSDLEREGARPGDEVALVGNWLAVDLHRQHLKPSAMKRGPDDFFEELSIPIAAGKSASVFAFPTAL